MVSFIWCLGIFISLSLMVSGNTIINHDNFSSDISTSGCFHSNYSYRCCETIGKIKGTVCFSFAYLPNDYGISFTITYNNYTLFNETISARNPPPICVGIPELEKISAKVCLILYDLTFADSHFHGCVSLKVFIFHVMHKRFDYGCFNIPSNSSMFIEYLKFLQNKTNSPEVIVIP
ncbi:uncharacterized protein [Chelonus insularis]|uniref:uncharacterized protein n=1 Tax=Chelonus insularis TaxID=460826 RepID=UPI00158C039D|nr:uncharacterized protein LOC118071761 [Chelonus insularis]